MEYGTMQADAMARPEGVKTTTGLMAGILVLETILSVYTISRMASILGGRSAIGGASIFGGVTGLIGIVIAAVFVYLYWQGNNVGRWAVLIDSGIVIVTALFSLGSLMLMHSYTSSLGLGPIVYISQGLNLLKACLAVYFFVFLNRPDIKAWFTRTNAGVGYPPATAATQGYASPYAQTTPVYDQPAAPYTGTPTETVVEPPPPPPPGFTV